MGKLKTLFVFFPICVFLQPNFSFSFFLPNSSSVLSVSSLRNSVILF